MLKRLQPRGISGGGLSPGRSPHPKLLVLAPSQFRPPRKGDVMFGVYPAGFSSVSRVATN